MNRILRAPWHDYTQRCIYLVTLNKSPLVENFGSLEGDCHLPAGTKGSSFIRTSVVGLAIKKVLKDFSLIEPKIRILQYALMPDHLHILLFVREQTEEILGQCKIPVELLNKKYVGTCQSDHQGATACMIRA